MRDGLQGLSDGLVESSAPLLEVDEASLKANELREGSSVALALAIPCMVSFAPGQERHVVLGLHGLEQVYCPQHCHCCMQEPAPTSLSCTVGACQGCSMQLLGICTSQHLMQTGCSSAGTLLRQRECVTVSCMWRCGSLGLLCIDDLQCRLQAQLSTGPLSSKGQEIG